MQLSIPLSLLGCLAASVVATEDNYGASCKPVAFTLNGNATNYNITGIDTSSVASIVQFLATAPTIAVAGPQTIAATYCVPAVKNSNNKKLQVLFGSITANRDDWQAQGGVGSDFPAYRPELYSYTQFANNLGYPTLALDRLGSGKSSHPDPVLVVQAPYEESLYNDLSKQLRAGSSALDGTKYDHLIYVGNSYGSQLGTGIAGAYPTAYDEYILTGFTSTVQKGFVGVGLTLAAPAAVVDPARFGNLSPGYLTTSSQVGRTNSFFGSKAQVDYEDIVTDLFFKRKDVVSLGSFVSVYGLPFVGAGFPGRVLVLDGEEDQPFCGPGSPVIGPAYCGTQPKDTGVLFPDAQYNYKTVNKIGHAVQLHLRSQVLFAVAHQFLAGQSFMGGTPA